MIWVWFSFAMVLILEGLFSFVQTIRFRHFFLREVFNPTEQNATRWPKVALLAPCRGMDVGLRENIHSWFALDYPDFKVFFIVDSDLDPVVPLLQEFGSGEILIAGKANESGQKVHNLQYAIQQLPAEYEVFAFIDSDCSVKIDWLRTLVLRLLLHPDHAATGYRWFTNSGNFGSTLRAAWNSSVLTLYKENSARNFAWGGATAILRETFQSARVFDFWKGSLSDDYSLTRAMQTSNRRVEFVPGALAFTHDSIRLPEFLRWSFRQLLITRIYYPRLWGAAFLFHSVWIAWIVTGFFFPGYFWPTFFALQLIQSLKADLRCRCVGAVQKLALHQRIYFWVIGPVVGLCNFGLLLSTIFTRTIRWRNVEYVLLGQNRLIIRHR
ncbi:glycosyltransferase family 2 protein [bacterium]|nr:glycosyltransferase family 2 protein [bacterium]MCI0606084.1 glycosyltransferase family 2 protein [bacterium]